MVYESCKLVECLALRPKGHMIRGVFFSLQSMDFVVDLESWHYGGFLFPSCRECRSHFGPQEIALNSEISNIFLQCFSDTLFV